MGNWEAHWQKKMHSFLAFLIIWAFTLTSTFELEAKSACTVEHKRFSSENLTPCFSRHWVPALGGNSISFQSIQGHFSVFLEQLQQKQCRPAQSLCLPHVGHIEEVEFGAEIVGAAQKRVCWVSPPFWEHLAALFTGGSKYPAVGGARGNLAEIPWSTFGQFLCGFLWVSGG